MPILLNILQRKPDGSAELMLGQSVDNADEAVKWLFHYRDNQKAVNEARVRNGHEPMLCSYELWPTEPGVPLNKDQIASLNKHFGLLDA